MTHARRPFRGWPEVGLLLLYFALRLYKLDRFPVFIDEAFHIAWARDVWSLHPFGGVPDGKALIPLAVAWAYPFENALFVSRAAVVLIGGGGLAALLALGRMLFNKPAAYLAAFLWIMLPFAFFFERLVMADALATSLAMITAALTVLALKRCSRALAILAGASLGLTILAKLPMVVYLAVPFAAWTLLTPRRDALRTLAVIYAASLAVIVPFMGLASIAGAGSFGLRNADRFTSTETGSLLSRIGGNAAIFLEWMIPYVGWPVLIMAALGVVWVIVRRDIRGLFAVLLTGLPILEFWGLSTYPVSRYYLTAAAPAMLLAAASVCWLAPLLRRMSKTPQRVVPVVIGLGLVMVATLPMARFQNTLTSAPAFTPLPEKDRVDYIAHSTSGFGLASAAEWLLEQSAETPITVICADGITCDRLSVYLYGAPGIRLERTDLLTPAWVRAENDAGRSVIVAIDDPPLVASYDPGSEYTLTLVGDFPRFDAYSFDDLARQQAAGEADSIFRLTELHANE